MTYTEILDTASEYEKRARRTGVLGVYEDAEASAPPIVRMQVMRALRELPPHLAYPRSKRRRPWTPTTGQRKQLIFDGVRAGLATSGLAQATGWSEATVRRYAKQHLGEHEAALAEVLNRALGLLEDPEVEDHAAHVQDTATFHDVYLQVIGLLRSLLVRLYLIGATDDS